MGLRGTFLLLFCLYERRTEADMTNKTTDASFDFFSEEFDPAKVSNSTGYEI